MKLPDDIGEMVLARCVRITSGKVWEGSHLGHTIHLDILLHRVPSEGSLAFLDDLHKVRDSDHLVDDPSWLVEDNHLHSHLVDVDELEPSLDSHHLGADVDEHRDDRHTVAET